MTAGLCVGARCLLPNVVTPERMRDYGRMVMMLNSGRMRFEFEAETYIYWFAQVPLTPPKPQPVAYDDDGFPRYLDSSSPHGQTVRPEVDILLGDDPRLAAYRNEETGFTVMRPKPLSEEDL